MKLFDAFRKSIEPTKTKLMDSAALFNMLFSSGNIGVNAGNATQYAAVYACVKVISESIAQLPVSIMRRDSSGQSVLLENDSLNDVISRSPNEFQTSFEFREMMQWHLLLRGNAYAQIIRSRGNVIELIPINPDRVTVDQKDDYTVVYEVRTKGNTPVRVTAANILHLKASSTNGFKGMSPIDEARASIDVALQAEGFASHMFRNRANPGGVLKHPGGISEDAQKRLLAQFESATTGENALRTVLLEEGMTYDRIGMTAEDAQFLQIRKFQNQQIYSLFRVPPHKVGDLERATFSNIEHMAIEFVQDTLMPWIRRWEGRIEKQLIGGTSKGGFAKFNLNGLLRGDTQSRFGAYATGRQWGWLSVNDIRDLEDMSRVQAGGDEYMKPLNMAPLDADTTPNPVDPAVSAVAKALEKHEHRYESLVKWIASTDETMNRVQIEQSRVVSSLAEKLLEKEKTQELALESANKSIEALSGTFADSVRRLSSESQELRDRQEKLLINYTELKPAIADVVERRANASGAKVISLSNVQRNERGGIIGAKFEVGGAE